MKLYQMMKINKRQYKMRDTNDTHVDESPYNYEEVSLNQVSTTKQLSDDEVTVSNVTSQHQSALQHNVEVNDKDELKNQSRLIADSERRWSNE